MSSVVQVQLADLPANLRSCVAQNIAADESVLMCVLHGKDWLGTAQESADVLTDRNLMHVMAREGPWSDVPVIMPLTSILEVSSSDQYSPVAGHRILIDCGRSRPPAYYERSPESDLYPLRFGTNRALRDRFREELIAALAAARAEGVGQAQRQGPATAGC